MFNFTYKRRPAKIDCKESRLKFFEKIKKKKLIRGNGWRREGSWRI